MAKLLRWERAWQHFTDEFLGLRRYSGPSWSRKSSRRRGRTREQAYWSLVKIAREFGISVYLKNDLGEAYDAFGERFTVGGHWDSHSKRQPAIRLKYRSFDVLAHEFAHAVDEMLGNWYYPVAAGELTACGAGYLLVCASTGIMMPRDDIEYAKRQGATAETLRSSEDRILAVFHEMASLVEVPHS